MQIKSPVHTLGVYSRGLDLLLLRLTAPSRQSKFLLIFIFDIFVCFLFYVSSP